MRPMIRSTALVLALSLPAAAMADGHTNAYPGNKGYVGPVTAEVTVHVPKPHVPEPRQPVVQSAANVWHDSGWTTPTCPPNFTGMFRGTLYCYQGMLVR